jgi:hypothetical protein
MKKLLLLLAVLLLWPNRPVFAWNPLTDVRDNLIWTFGKTAEVGEAVKLCGAGDLKPGETATSMLAGIADYRFLSFSYGGTRVNKADTNFTDTAKIGLRLTSFFDLFKNPPTAEMAWMRNLNIGPSYAMSLFNSPHAGTLFLDINFTFGKATPTP